MSDFKARIHSEKVKLVQSQSFTHSLRDSDKVTEQSHDVTGQTVKRVSVTQPRGTVIESTGQSQSYRAVSMRRLVC